MAFLARGGFLPVITPALMGIGFILVGWFVDPLFGVAPSLGIFMLMLSAFFANFWRDPDRPIPRDEGIIVSPADGHVMFAKRERATGRRPSNAEMADAEQDDLTGTCIQNRAMKYYHFQPSKDSKQFLKERSLMMMFGELQFSCPHLMFMLTAHQLLERLQGWNTGLEKGCAEAHFYLLSRRKANTTSE